MIMEYIGIVMVLLGLLWTCGFAYAHFSASAKAKAAESWPIAGARVLSSEVRVEESSDNDGGSTTWYNPIIVYKYSVGGREYQGSRLRFGNPRSASRKKADAAIAPYPPGTTPLVRYNPQDPKEAVLETKKPSPLYLIMAPFGLLFVGFGLFWNSFAA